MVQQKGQCVLEHHTGRVVAEVVPARGERLLRGRSYFVDNHDEDVDVLMYWGGGESVLSPQQRFHLKQQDTLCSTRSLHRSNNTH